MSISICLIVKNEARYLGKCLCSFKNLGDEIIVIDTGSTDKTKTIAKGFGARVFDYKWKNNFSDARNFAISKAKKNWIMMVDADDIIEKNTIKKIHRYLENTSKKVISLPYIYTHTENQKGNFAWLPKIWKKSPNLKYVYPVHEYLDISKINPDLTEKLDAPIIHNKINQDFPKSFIRNIKIMEPFIKKHPYDLRILYYLIHDNRHIGEFKKVIFWCKKYFEAKPNDSVEINKVFMMQGISHLNMDEIFQAQISFLMAIGAQPKLIEPYLELGDMYYRQKRFDEAIHMYRCAKICKIPEKSRSYFNQAVYDYFADRKLAYILPMTGRNKEGLRHAKSVLEYCPKDVKLKDHIKKLEKICSK